MGAVQFSKGTGSFLDFGLCSTSLGERQPTARFCERGRVFKQFSKLGNGAGGDKRAALAQGAPARILGALGDNPDIRKTQFGRHRIQEARAFLQRLDKRDLERRVDDRDDKARIAASTANVGVGVTRAGEAPGDAEQLEAFRVLPPDDIGTSDSGDTRVVGGLYDQCRMALQEREPALGLAERREQARQIFPREFHEIPRRTIT